MARSYHKLLAFKDEYEVARLHISPAFRQALKDAFADGGRLRFHFAPPFLAGRDPVTGVPRKKAFGEWIIPVLRVLARMRVLRGTRWDPFGYAAERRLERQLIHDYEARLQELLTGLNRSRLPLAIQVAQLPEMIRGFGHVKARNVDLARERQRVLMQEWERT